MGLVLNTNCGFVTVAPVADPTEGVKIMDAVAWALKDTTPAVLTKITEIGWWCDTATQEANFEVGLYSHNAGDDKPDARLYVDNTNAKGTTAGWKTVAVDWEIVPETVYWIAVQLDNTATQTNTNYKSSGRRSVGPDSTTLLNPWGAGSEASEILAFYALVGESGPTEYAEGTLSVTGVGSVSLVSEPVTWNEGILVVIGAGLSVLVSEVAKYGSTWPSARPSDYDPDLYWDEETEIWVATRMTGPGAFADYVVFVGEEGEIYFGSV